MGRKLNYEKKNAIINREDTSEEVEEKKVLHGIGTASTKQFTTHQCRRGKNPTPHNMPKRLLCTVHITGANLLYTS